ncbi:carbohydrate ABC transporter permease [Nakamurella lactea]|uniref:carbohydrate ABC transporter permease n=1 Tax=Nakamurella lactea TaxID=459515 RepID=UPI00055A4ECA
MLALGSLIFLIPFYLLIRNSLSVRREIAGRTFTLWPETLQWDNFSAIFANDTIPFARSLFNSVVVSIVQTTLTVALAAMAGYGLARIPFRFSGLLTGVVLATLMIPAAVTFVPTFVMVSSLGWVSSLQGLIIPGLFSALAVFLFRQQFTDFPKDLEEAGRIDGLGYFGVFWRVVLPNSGAFVAAVAAITFLGSWNAFLWPLVIGQDPSSWTVQVALSSYTTSQSPNYPQLFAAATIAILPVMVLFIGLQRFIRQGYESTGSTG